MCICVYLSLEGGGGKKGKRRRDISGGRKNEKPYAMTEGEKRKKDPMQYSFPAMDFHLIHKKTI